MAAAVEAATRWMDRAERGQTIGQLTLAVSRAAGSQGVAPNSLNTLTSASRAYLS